MPQARVKIRPYAKASELTPERYRCLQLLVEFARGEHHLGKMVEWGYGIAMEWGHVATFDSDDLTRLVLLAHHHLCRVSVTPHRFQDVHIIVNPRQAEGNYSERHPGIPDLALRVKSYESAAAAELQRRSAVAAELTTSPGG